MVLDRGGLTTDRRIHLSGPMQWRPSVESAAQFDVNGGRDGAVMVWPWERVCIVLDSASFTGAECVLETALLAGDGCAHAPRTVHISQAAVWELQSAHVAEVSRLEAWVSGSKADI
jgi:hypothetical protein